MTSEVVEVVKYHNDVHSASLRKFNAVELNIFMAILTRMRDKDEEEVVFSFDELKKLVNWTGKNNKEFASMLNSMYQKLIECNIKIETKEKLIRFVLFTRYSISMTKPEIAIKVNPDFKFLLNSLLSHFTRFELNEFISLKSSYAKEFYRRMKQFRNTGIWVVSLQEFKRLLDIPEKYNIDAINKRILDPIIEELGSKYQLKITKQYDHSKRGRPSVSGFTFTFLKDSELNAGPDTKAVAVVALAPSHPTAPTAEPKPERRDVNDVDVVAPSAPPIDAEVKEVQAAPVSQARKKARKKAPPPNVKFYTDNYIGRTIRMKDQDFDKYNCLKVASINYNPETGKLGVTVRNVDDNYENTILFDNVTIWENFFKRNLI